MTDERLPTKEDALERRLLDLGREIDYPTTPDIAGSVRQRLSRQPVPLRAGRRRWPAAVAACLIAVLLTGLALTPGLRSTVAHRLGVGGIQIIVQPTIPIPPELGRQLLVGNPTTLADATPRLSYVPLPPPTLLGGPDGVYLLDPPPGGQLSYVYLPRDDLPEVDGSGVGILVSQFQGTTDDTMVSKVLEPGTSLEIVRVGSDTGFWLSGQPHVFLYKNAQGSVRQDTIRLAANVLIWDADGVTVRIESNLPKEQVIAIAESMNR